MRQGKKGVTFMELIITMVILSILTASGAALYTNTIERSRTAEAKVNLGTIRTMAKVYYEENNAYPVDAYLRDTLLLPIGVNNACGNVNYFFQYHIDGGAGTGSATAYRCTSGGKLRQGTTAYSLTLSIDGAPNSNPAGWW
ncbi:MAG: prepilin-type N-terminal cleavage/methylation domain-containing protein [Candidatus Omnitrophica bacterium]|nr:prepilin-type N-terminal cleavage/methylation domain-containing protein [Candidatus Omnitrophota bacterium]